MRIPDTPEHGAPEALTSVLPRALDLAEPTPLQLLISVEQAAPVLGKSAGHVRRLISKGEDFGGALLPKKPHQPLQFSLIRLLRYCGAEEAALRAEALAVQAWLDGDDDLPEDDRLAS